MKTYQEPIFRRESQKLAFGCGIWNMAVVELDPLTKIRHFDPIDLVWDLSKGELEKTFSSSSSNSLAHCLAFPLHNALDWRFGG